MAEILTANSAGYSKAAELLRAGQLAALPTDTVYGLAGLASNQEAIAEIYKVKNRPKEKALSVVIFTPDHAKQLVKIPPLAQTLMDEFWPGALTLVLPALEHVATLPDTQTLAVRCPDVGWTKGFMDAGFEGPLVLPSANISGEAAPVTAAQTDAAIGDKIPLILDGGTCKKGQESTIIAVDGDRARLLRVGAIAPERLAAYNIDMVNLGKNWV